jgi:hypothetical protein
VEDRGEKGNQMTTDFNLSEERKKILNEFEPEHHWLVLRVLQYIECQDRKFVRLLKEEPTDKINSAEVFLLEYGYGNLVLNEVMSKDKWIYVSDIMIAFLKWKTDTLAGNKLIEEKKE